MLKMFCLQQKELEQNTQNNKLERTTGTKVQKNLYLQVLNKVESKKSSSRKKENVPVVLTKRHSSFT